MFKNFSIVKGGWQGGLSNHYYDYMGRLLIVLKLGVIGLYMCHPGEEERKDCILE